MQVTKIYTPKETLSLPFSISLDIPRKILRENLTLKPFERLLIVTDPTMEKKEGAWWFEAGKHVSDHTQMVVFDGMTENAQEPPALVTLMMSKSHVVILQTSYSLSHTKARKLATDKLARVASLPTAHLDLLTRTLQTDFASLKELTVSLAGLLTTSSHAHITSPAGTDLTLSLDSRSAIADTGYLTNPGDFGNLPAGEAFIAPIEGSAGGTIVFDGSFAGIDLDAPITITVRDGLATSITGKKAAAQLEKLLSNLPNAARNIGELGIGTNKSANPTGELIEAEKAYGTVHIALGRNDSFGGTVNVPFHSDGVILNPTLKLDDKTIIKLEKFTTESST